MATFVWPWRYSGQQRVKSLSKYCFSIALEGEQLHFHTRKIHIPGFKDDIGSKNYMLIVFIRPKHDPLRLQKCMLFRTAYLVAPEVYACLVLLACQAVLASLVVLACLVALACLVIYACLV